MAQENNMSLVFPMEDDQHNFRYYREEKEENENTKDTFVLARSSLQSTTLFVKIDIHDLCTTLPHHLLIQALEKFLRIYVRSEQINGTSITTIVQRVQLILENQFNIHENQFYQQIVRGSNSSSLIKGIVDIYLYHLTYKLYARLFNRKEVIARCLNQKFFIWNEPKHELLAFLKKINCLHSKHIHIKITTSIDYKNTISYS
ncbi:unnamed protein product [Rotaria sordida]|uniref:Maturase K n=1 Tax=Rotaria sordida TaxID=392033 RepID=A0A815APD7_9BILA|nr:unnamed protein product [Rotaria sordida]CAF1539739.1 unnamed protein product [Rotaria sordida]